MKKMISVLLVVLLAAALFVSCGQGALPKEPEAASDSGKLKIVATIFPVYDWIRQIVGENNETVELTLLLKDGVDLHSYQPSTADMIAISDADIFVYVGGHSDSWVQAALKNGSNPERIAINLFEVLADSLKPMPMSESMEHHHDHGEEDHDDHDGHDHDHDGHDNHDNHDHHDHDHDGHHDHDDHDDHEHDSHEHHHDHDANECDEHIWLSLPRAGAAVDALAKQLAQADPQNAEAYQANAEKYKAELAALDQEYRSTVDAGHQDTIIFADRFPFFYLADDYGLSYDAAFTGCSAESEASFETVALLAQKIDTLGLKQILTVEKRTHKIAETVIESTKDGDQSILVMDSLQSVTQNQIDQGLTYLDVMKSNLEVLKTALQ